ncbi:hypothetical protein [Paenibacillus massiliensis]|uniref:hypothetical protein n=1 Tax=Paenibacillus massiliensis TaxID=225917 RepID=UPI0004243CFD|nr:hypothetical protein [Paenibacillus massiliensis]
MDKQEFIGELDIMIRGLEKLQARAADCKDKREANRLLGKIEGVELARDHAKQWLGEDI